MTPFSHESVMPDECTELLNIKGDGIYVDATTGCAGHTKTIAGRLTTGHVYGFDKDDAALAAAAERLASYPHQVTLVRGDFRHMKHLLAGYGVSAVDGVLFDLGVSSPQLDDRGRGFSYRDAGAPLDMRMDRSQALTAWEIVNRWETGEIARVLRDYGEERYAGRIAGAIARYRENEPIDTAGQLVDIIRKAMPGKALREEQHPARRSFQALRLAVGDELGALEEGLAAAIGLLKPEGRAVCISFHSLEDRIVKTQFAQGAQGCTCPPDFPACVCGKKPVLRILTRKPLKASNEELAKNPRARSACLRAAMKL